MLHGLVHQPRIVRNLVLPVVDLFTDAASTPARIAGVLFGADTQSPLYTEWVPDGRFWNALLLRSDNQIVALELVAVVVSIATFARLLVARTVRLWIDNSAGELQLRRGSARSDDHNRLVHSVWLSSIEWGFNFWIERVPSKLNVADEPSRRDYRAMREIGALSVDPTIPSEFSTYGRLQA